MLKLLEKKKCEKAKAGKKRGKYLEPFRFSVRFYLYWSCCNRFQECSASNGQRSWQMIRRANRTQRLWSQKYRRMVWRPSHHVWRSSQECARRDARHSLCDARHRHNACAFWAGLWSLVFGSFHSFLHLLFFPFLLVLQINHLRQIERKYRVISNKMK
jgi:hypothetical protein